MKTGKIYIIGLESGNYYVGSTTEVKRRWAQHIAGTGAAECKRDKPEEIIYEYDTEIIENKLVLYIEDMVTLMLMDRISPKRVIGGRYLTTDYRRASNGWIEEEHKRIYDAYQHTIYMSGLTKQKMKNAVEFVEKIDRERKYKNR